MSAKTHGFDGRRDGKRVATAMELCEVHTERGAELCEALCELIAKNRVDGEMDADRMRNIAATAEDIALCFKTAAILETVVPALTHCPECGAYLDRRG